MRYLPDFYIRKLDFFFEVKGREPTVEEQLKADALCAATGKVVVISSGPPNPRRDQWDDDIFAYCPEMDCETGQLYADWHKGGFVYGRRETHPKSSLHLGNLMFLPVFNEADWQSVFLSSANQRFGIFE